MYARIITFVLNGLDEASYRDHAEQLAPEFAKWPGLLRKVWLADGPQGRHGGIYLFADKAAADASRNTEVFRGMSMNPHFADLHLEEFAVLEAPTALTTRDIDG